MSVASPHWSAGTPIPPPPSSKIGHISQAAKARNCASANIIHNTWLKACCTILCISSWTSSTHRRLGSSNRRICLLTKSSNEISGTNKAGRGPCEREKKIKIWGKLMSNWSHQTAILFLTVAFLMAVSISFVESPSRAFMSWSVWPKMSWKM